MAYCYPIDISTKSNKCSALHMVLHCITSVVFCEIFVERTQILVRKLHSFQYLKFMSYLESSCTL